MRNELSKSDYFDPKRKWTTIVRSEEAALIRAEQILAEIGKDGVWDDPDFGPPKGKPEDPAKMSLYFNGEAPKGYVKPEQIVWMRPDPKAKFISADASAQDVIQGAIGDCWFIGALSVLATRDELLRGGLT